MSNSDQNAKRRRLNETVKFNVGGKRFEVPKDLIMKDLDDSTDNGESDNRTMLAKLVSDTWLQNPESEVYIGRDGDRFTYVLDYLRHGEVVLPNIISIDSFLKDLDYYGIPFQQANIKKESSYVTEEAVDLNKAEKRKKHMLLAIDIMKDFIEKSRTQFYGESKVNGNYYTISRYDGSMVDEYLAKFGLKMTGTFTNSGTFTVDLLNKK